MRTESDIPGTTQRPMERLAGQIGTFQDRFEVLAKALSLKEMARLFAGMLSSHFQEIEITLFHNAIPGKGWQQLFGGAAGDPGEAFGSIDERRFAMRYLDGEQRRASVVQPLLDRSLLGMFLSPRKVAFRFAEEDKVSLQLFGQLFASAYQPLLHRRNEKELVFSLNHRVLQLNSLIDTGIEVSKLTHEGSLPQLALERAASLTNASRGVLIVSGKDQPAERYSFPASDALGVDNDSERRIQTSFQFFDTTYTFQLYDKESRSGFIVFDETDRLLLDALTRQVHASLENRYLLQEAIDKQKIERDIAVAASIQQRILPESLPALTGYDIFGTNIPTKSVGGDYYDCIPLADGRVALVVADVAGKGIPAALLVSSFHAYLNAYLENSLPLVKLAQRLNSVICKASTEDKFITAFLALLDPTTGRMESLSAGHNPVYLVKRDRTIQELNNGGVALGMLDMEFPFSTDEVVVEPGERLFLYTDGLTEAMNAEQELYDNIRSVKEFVSNKTSPSAKQFIQEMIADVREFVGTAPQADDITVLYLVRQ